MTTLKYYDPDDFVHIDELDKYIDAESLIKDLIKHVYITGNVKDLEDSLDELCDVFNLKIPYSKPIIRGI